MSNTSIIQHLDSFCSAIHFLNQHGVDASIFKNDLDMTFEFQNPSDIDMIQSYSQRTKLRKFSGNRTPEEDLQMVRSIIHLSKKSYNVKTTEELIARVVFCAYFNGVKFYASSPGFAKWFCGPDRRFSMARIPHHRDYDAAKSEEQIFNIKHPNFLLDDFKDFIDKIAGHSISSNKINGELTPSKIWSYLWSEKNEWPESWTRHYQEIEKDIIYNHLSLSKEDLEMATELHKNSEFSFSVVDLIQHDPKYKYPRNTERILNSKTLLQSYIDRGKLLKISTDTNPHTRNNNHVAL